MVTPLRALPLFPLPVVLLPGVPMPLHIFEPRYRTMLADCMDGTRRFGVIHLAAGEDEAAIAPGTVGCVAHIEHAIPLPDGRSNIVVMGEERFALERLVPTSHPYHMAEVRDVEDIAEPTGELAALADELRRRFDRVGRAARTLADDTEPLPTLPDDPGLLSFAIAGMVDLDAAARQRLLASRSALGRLRELDELLTRATVPLETRAAVHVRARTNGRGHGTVEEGPQA